MCSSSGCKISCVLCCLLFLSAENSESNMVVWCLKCHRNVHICFYSIMLIHVFYLYIKQTNMFLFTNTHYCYCIFNIFFSYLSGFQIRENIFVICHNSTTTIAGTQNNQLLEMVLLSTSNMLSRTQYTRTGYRHTGECIYWKYVVEAKLSKLTYVED